MVADESGFEVNQTGCDNPWRSPKKLCSCQHHSDQHGAWAPAGALEPAAAAPFLASQHIYPCLLFCLITSESRFVAGPFAQWHFTYPQPGGVFGGWCGWAVVPEKGREKETTYYKLMERISW